MFDAFVEIVAILVMLIAHFLQITIIIITDIAAMLNPSTITFTSNPADLLALAGNVLFGISIIALVLFFIYFCYLALFGDLQQIVDDESTIVPRGMEFKPIPKKPTAKKQPALPKPSKKQQASPNQSALPTTPMTPENLQTLIQTAIQQAMLAAPTAPTPEPTLAMPDIASLVQHAVQTSLTPLLEHTASLSKATQALQARITTLEETRAADIDRAVQKAIAAIPSPTTKDPAAATQQLLDELAIKETHEESLIEKAVDKGAKPIADLKETNELILESIDSLEKSLDLTTFKLDQVEKQQQQFGTLASSVTALTGLIESKFKDTAAEKEQQSNLQTEAADDKLAGMLKDFSNGIEAKLTGITEAIEKQREAMHDDSCAMARSLTQLKKRQDEQPWKLDMKMGALLEKVDSLKQQGKGHEVDFDEIKEIFDVRCSSLDTALEAMDKALQATKEHAAFTSMNTTQILKKQDGSNTQLQTIAKDVEEVKGSQSVLDASLEVTQDCVVDEVLPLVKSIEATISAAAVKRGHVASTAVSNTAGKDEAAPSPGPSSSQTVPKPASPPTPAAPGASSAKKPESRAADSAALPPPPKKAEPTPPTPSASGHQKTSSATKPAPPADKPAPPPGPLPAPSTEHAAQPAPVLYDPFNPGPPPAASSSNPPTTPVRPAPAAQPLSSLPQPPQTGADHAPAPSQTPAPSYNPNPDGGFAFGGFAPPINPFAGGPAAAAGSSSSTVAPPKIPFAGIVPLAAPSSSSSPSTSTQKVLGTGGNGTPAPRQPATIAPPKNPFAGFGPPVFPPSTSAQKVQGAGGNGTPAPWQPPTTAPPSNPFAGKGPSSASPSTPAPKVREAGGNGTPAARQPETSTDASASSAAPAEAGPSKSRSKSPKVPRTGVERQLGPAGGNETPAAPPAMPNIFAAAAEMTKGDKGKGKAKAEAGDDAGAGPAAQPVLGSAADLEKLLASLRRPSAPLGPVPETRMMKKGGDDDDDDESVHSVDSSGGRKDW